MLLTFPQTHVYSCTLPSPVTTEQSREYASATAFITGSCLLHELLLLRGVLTSNMRLILNATQTSGHYDCVEVIVVQRTFSSSGRLCASLQDTNYVWS